MKSKSGKSKENLA